MLCRYESLDKILGAVDPTEGDKKWGNWPLYESYLTPADLNPGLIVGIDYSHGGLEKGVKQYFEGSIENPLRDFRGSHSRIKALRDWAKRRYDSKNKEFVKKRFLEDRRADYLGLKKNAPGNNSYHDESALEVLQKPVEEISLNTKDWWVRTSSPDKRIVTLLTDGDKLLLTKGIPKLNESWQRKVRDSPRGHPFLSELRRWMVDVPEEYTVVGNGVFSEDRFNDLVEGRETLELNGMICRNYLMKIIHGVNNQEDFYHCHEWPVEERTRKICDELEQNMEFYKDNDVNLVLLNLSDYDWGWLGYERINLKDGERGEFIPAFIDKAKNVFETVVEHQPNMRYSDYPPNLICSWEKMGEEGVETIEELGSKEVWRTSRKWRWSDYEDEEKKVLINVLKH